MSLSPGSLQGLARDALADAVRRAQITALDLAGAVLRLADERSSAMAVPKAEAAFLLACRDVVRVVESMEAQDRPKGWDDVRSDPDARPFMPPSPGSAATRPWRAGHRSGGRATPGSVLP